MATIGIRRTFDAAHRLFNHLGKCHNLHGHTYIIEIVVGGEERDGGMVLDFYLLSQVIQEELNNWDHRVILQRVDPLVDLLCSGALDCCIMLMDDEPTVEHLAARIAGDLGLTLGTHGVELISIRLYETPNCWADKHFQGEL
jgi:6-pyruvoyltetrahydropterin/6-carboxytetrahydropterin synthase